MASQGCYSCLVLCPKPEVKRFSCRGVESRRPSEKGLTYGRAKSNLLGLDQEHRAAVKNTLAATNRHSRDH